MKKTNQSRTLSRLRFAQKFLDREKVRDKHIPQSPGAYMFRNKANRIIYIGKALNLKKRVASYFTKTTTKATKVNLIKNIAKIDYKITDSEIEALVLESLLIKKHKPKYNILMRDDKNYFFVGITEEQFPRIYITHQPITETKQLTTSSKAELATGRATNNPQLKTNKLTTNKLKAKFIGPFTDGGALKNTLKYLRTVFPYCTCRKPHKGKCLNAHLGRCLEFCCKKLTHNLPPTTHNYKEYNQNINSIIKILKGQKKSLIKQLQKEMKMEAKKQNFEKAAEIRDKMENLKKILAHKHVLRANNEIISDAKIFIDTNRKVRTLKKGLKRLIHLKNMPNRIEAYDISNIQGTAATASMAVFTTYNQQLTTNNLPFSPNKKEYRRFKIKLTSKPNDVAMIREVLKRRLQHIPDVILSEAPSVSRGAKSKDLIMQNNTADEILQLRSPAYGEVAPLRMTKKKNYWSKPDLILVDGGKPQLNAALVEIKKAGLDIPVVALAKPHPTSLQGDTSPKVRERAYSAEVASATKAGRGNPGMPPPSVAGRPLGSREIASLHLRYTRNDNNVERIYTANKKNPIMLPKNSPLLHLLQRLRDEAHRFAKKYHHLD